MNDSSPLNTPPNSAAPLQFDVWEFPPRTKHASIFRVWSALPVGEQFVLVSDHHPVPLYYQFSVKYAGAFDWEYLERGSDVFRVRITRLQSTAGPAPTPPTPSTHPQVVAADTGGAKEVDARGLEPPKRWSGRNANT